MSLIKLGAVSAGAGWSASPLFKLFSEYVALPVWGVPVTVIMAALFGAGLSLFFGDPIESRRALWGQIIAATMFGTAVSVLVADGMGWGWAQKNISMFALMTAAMVRWFLPSVIERGKQFIREFKFSFVKKDSAGDGK